MALGGAARLVMAGAMATALPQAALAQYEGRSFTITPAAVKATVGDTVRIAFRLITHERDLLTDTVPNPVAELPAGVRVYAVERLRRDPNRVFTGEALLVFYRPGVQEIPAFGVPWVQVVTGHRGTVSTESATIEIVPVLPAGNPTLRDIREPETSPGPGPLILIAAGALLTALAAALLRRKRPAHEVPPESRPAMPAPAASPYDTARARLDTLERARGYERGDPAEHYAAVADTLRDYLEAAHDIPARERTSSELLWALPPRLTESGLRRLAAQVLAEADLVKFARGRPGTEATVAHLTEARELLRRWHEAGAMIATPSEADAIR